MKTPVVLISMLFICVSVFGQNLKLVNTSNPLKIKIFNELDYLEFQMKDINDDDNVVNTATYTGHLISIGKNTLTLRNDYEYLETTVFDPYKNFISTRELYGDTVIMRPISYSDIDYIVHHKKSEKVFKTIGTIFLFTTIIAPVFAMDYKSFTIDTDSYFVYAGGSIFTSLLSYSIAWKFGKRKFSFIPNDETDVNVWGVTPE